MSGVGEFDPAKPVHFIHRTDLFPFSAPYKCGAAGDQASSNGHNVTCADCLRLMEVGTPTPRHKPPRMVDEHGMTDGVFTFYDVDHDNPEQLPYMEVVPQTTGNVEIEIGGELFTLSHLDRADLLRALLHDFHYSPERGGPNGDH